MPESDYYDPLDYGNLTMNLVRELMAREPRPLPLGERFPGPGVYALFYHGDYPPYDRIRSPSANLRGEGGPAGRAEGWDRSPNDFTRPPQTDPRTHRLD